MPRVLTFGTYDVFHFGHLNILRRAREMGNELYVGVSSDKMNFAKKGRYPIYPEGERMAIVQSSRYVDHVFLEESMQMKREYLTMYMCNILVMGDDWVGKFDEFKDVCEVIYLPRTVGISTTETIERIRTYE